MAPFAVTIRDLGPMEVKFFSNIPSEDAHSIQTHVVDLNLLVRQLSVLKLHHTTTNKMEFPYSRTIVKHVECP